MDTPTNEDATILILLDGPGDAWVPTLRSLARDDPGRTLAIASTHREESNDLRDLGIMDFRDLELSRPSEAIDDIARDRDQHLLVISDPVVVPQRFLATAVGIANNDLRCASVSFLSNAAGHLSFPRWHEPTNHQIFDRDEERITRLLRSTEQPILPAPIPYSTGAAVLLTRQGLSAVGRFPDHDLHDFGLALADFSCRARSRGLLDYVDPTTFITRPGDVGKAFVGNTWLLPHQEDWLRSRHPAALEAVYELTDSETAFEQAFRAAHAAAFGLRVLIDATMLSQREMGTQVTVVALVKELIAHRDVSYLGIALREKPPNYARHLFQDSEKVEVKVVRNGNLSGFPPVDIVHRPFQVDPEVSMSSWHSVGARTVLTMLDLIAFQIPSYQESTSKWFEYRSSIRRAVGQVDAVIAISDEVRHQIELERLPIEKERLFTVLCGVDHLRGDEEESMPESLLLQGFAAEPFLLVLGTNYTHKNRDIAIRCLEELRKRGHDLSLVLAGAHVPYGSSRVAEETARSADLLVWTVPDVSTSERNWLLRHADAVLYPTAAEGFGLVPNEAAAFGTPTVFVAFGPLAERFATVPVTAADWSAEAFADATEHLLIDPALSKAQVEAISEDTERYDWHESGNEIVRIYRSLIGRPAIAHGTMSSSWEL